MKYIVSVSGGAGSTLAAHLTVERVGLENVVLLFADTNSEDKTLYQLLIKMGQKLKPIIWLNEHLSIWDCFDKEGIIRTKTGACKASLELKQKPIAKWVTDNCDPKNTILVSGLDWTEETRIKRFDKRWKPYRTWHPLRQNRMALCDMKRELKKLGYPAQELYDKEYPHNNCGGTCVLAGLSQWAGIRRDYPEKFEAAKKWEMKFNEGRKEKYSILKDQRKGSDKTMMLAEFERRIDINDVNLKDFRTGCGCMLGEQLELSDLFV